MMAYDASDRKHVRKAEKEARISDNLRLEIVKGLMSIPGGRAYVFDRLAEAHLFNTSFNAENPQIMAFAEGERNVGLRLFNDIMVACPDRFVAMIQERNALNAARSSDGELNGGEDTDGRVDQSGDAAVRSAFDRAEESARYVNYDNDDDGDKARN